MKTYILSVNTLMWNLTSERHDNCAPCLGLILPIRWVTPPPNSSVWSVLPMALHLLCLHILFVFILNLSSWLSSLCWFDCLSHIYTYIYTGVLSSTAFTYSYVFSLESFELSECDRTLTSLCFLSQTLSLQIICILLNLSNVFSASLLAEDTETNIKSAFNANSFTWNPEKWERPPDNLGMRGTWNNPRYAAWWPRVPQMWITRGTYVITLSRPCPYKYAPHHSHYLFFHSRTNPSATASPRRCRRRSA